jgi:hypothetical protein
MRRLLAALAAVGALAGCAVAHGAQPAPAVPPPLVTTTTTMPPPFCQTYGNFAGCLGPPMSGSSSAPLPPPTMPPPVVFPPVVDPNA